MSKMYDAFLSEITNFIIWTKEGDKVIAAFRVKGEDWTLDGRIRYTHRVIRSRYFSNHSIDVVVYQGKRYLIDSKIEIIEG